MSDQQNRIVRMTLDEAQQAIDWGESRTDWKRLARLNDDEGERLADEASEGTPNWLQATTELPRPRQPVSIRLGADVLEWFRQHGTGYQSRINQVLRRYVEANRG